MKLLVTGGSGYIGSHTCIELLNCGHDLIVVDNLSNSKIEAIKRVEKLTGKRIIFSQTDLLDKPGLTDIFANHKIDVVMHFAGLKAVGESVEKPLQYYHNNITGTINLCQVMQEHQVKNIVFSSSATVYGDPRSVPITEDFPLQATNPYGQTKLTIEKMLTDIYQADEAWNVILLRYFNPVGAHESGEIGEDPNGIPNNLMPFISQVAVRNREYLNVFGNDYTTRDGSGIRDYIHVVDLAKGHMKSLAKIDENAGLKIYNLGTGKGYSVFEVIKAFEQASGRKIPFKVVARRNGDIAECYADASLAAKELSWQAERDLVVMCRDAWRWQTQNPQGF